MSHLIQLSFSENEKDEKAHFVIGIVHDGARYLPDLLDYMGSEHPNLTVKAGVLSNSSINTMTMEQYREQVRINHVQVPLLCDTDMNTHLVAFNCSIL